MSEGDDDDYTHKLFLIQKFPTKYRKVDFVEIFNFTGITRIETVTNIHINISEYDGCATVLVLLFIGNRLCRHWTLSEIPIELLSIIRLLSSPLLLLLLPRSNFLFHFFKLQNAICIVFLSLHYNNNATDVFFLFFFFGTLPLMYMCVCNLFLIPGIRHRVPKWKFKLYIKSF